MSASVLPPCAMASPRRKGTGGRTNPPRAERSRSDRPPLGIDQHFAAADMVGDADDAVLLHPLDQPRGIVVADAELALEVGGRGLLALRHGLHGLAIELRLGIVLAGRLALEHVAAVL